MAIIVSHVGCSKVSVSHVINGVALTLPKVELCFGARSLYCNNLSLSLEIGFLQTCKKPLLNCKHKLKQLQWANMHKDCTKMHKKWSKVIF